MKKKTASQKKSPPHKSVVDLVNKMSMKGMRAFLIDALRGNLPISGDLSSLPHIELIEVFHRLDPYPRQVFEDLIMEFLSDLAMSHSSLWMADSGDELLLLAASIFSKSPRKAEIIDTLLYILDKRWDLKNDAINLHWRTAQTAVGISYRAKPELWINMFTKGGLEYASLVIVGLSLSSIDDAMNWLEREIANEIVFDEFMALIPYLKEEHRSDILRESFRKLLPFIPETRLNEFRKITQSLGIKIISGVLIGFDKSDLLQLSGELGITVSSYTSDSDIRLIIEEHLRIQSTSRPPYRNGNLDVEFITFIGEFVDKQPYALSEKFRTRFVDYGKSIIEKQDLGEDAPSFIACVTQIQEKAIDIIKRISEIVTEE